MADQNHKISQETFDETLLENEELFELSPEDAIAETISQFKQQGIQNIESYIITSHPDSDIGKQERQTRKDFEKHLNLLDNFIKEDGTVNLEGAGDESLENASKVLHAIECVSKYCEGTFEDYNTVKGSTKCEKSLPFLTLFHSSNSLYTFMSFLGIVPVANRQSCSGPTKEQIMILNEICKVLVSILTPRRASERQIKNLIKEKFVAMERILVLISFFVTKMKENDSSRTKASETLLNLVRLACAVCRNSEKNKVSLVRALKNSKQNFENISTVALLVQVLSVSIEVYKEEGLERNACLVSVMTELMTLVAVLCRYDDFRPEGSGGGLGIDSSYGMNVSSAHDHVMEFHRNGVVPLLHEISLLALTIKDNFTSEPDSDASSIFVTEEVMVSLAGAALSATRAIAVNDDIVQALVAVGVLKVVNMSLMMGVATSDFVNTDAEQIHLLKTYKQQLTVSAIGLVRNLCGNDEIKTTLCLGTPSDPSSSSLHMVLEGMRLYRDNALIQEHGLGTLAAMGLRKPANALRIVQENGPREIIAAMGKFPNNVLVQRQGALAIRNIVSRLVANDATGDTHGSGNRSATTESGVNNINVRDAFLDLGAEVVLRQITGRHQGSVDEAYAALRDLGCEVSMLKYDTETNTVTRKTQMFGEVKSNFRAVYDESDDVQNKIATIAERS